jgi:hypothetical protein
MGGFKAGLDDGVIESESTGTCAYFGEGVEYMEGGIRLDEDG